MLAPAMPSAGKLERKFKFAKARAERCLHQLCRAQANSNEVQVCEGLEAVIASGPIPFIMSKP